MLQQSADISFPMCPLPPLLKFWPFDHCAHPSLSVYRWNNTLRITSRTEENRWFRGSHGSLWCWKLEKERVVSVSGQQTFAEIRKLRQGKLGQNELTRSGTNLNWPGLGSRWGEEGEHVGDELTGGRRHLWQRGHRTAPGRRGNVCLH